MSVHGKKIKRGTEARAAMQQGVNELADAVGATMGYNGRTVIIGNLYGKTPHATKDGVTVAKNIVFKDMEKDMGAILVKDVAIKVAEVAGDGTTTATVLARTLINEGIKAVDAGHRPLSVKKGIDMVVKAAVEKIKSLAKPVTTDGEEIYSISTISSNNDVEIGKIVGDAYKAVGADGEIAVEVHGSYETIFEATDGITFNKGLLTPHFINTPGKAASEMSDVSILMYDRKLSSFKELENVFKAILGTESNKNKSVLIICDDLVDEALAVVAQNVVDKRLTACVVKCPEFGSKRLDVMNDIAVATGGTFITEANPKKLSALFENPVKGLELLGTAKKVVVSRDRTVIFGAGGDKNAVAEVVTQLKELASNEQDQDQKSFIKNRIARLTKGFGVIKVGGGSEVETLEKKDRIDDAVCAVRAALEEGVVPGGGYIYLYAMNSTTMGTADEAVNAGAKAAQEALKAPLRQLNKNSGNESTDIATTRFPETFDHKTENLVDAFEAGLLDPAKVSRIALEAAASVAGTFLLTEFIVTDDL